MFHYVWPVPVQIVYSVSFRLSRNVPVSTLKLSLILSGPKRPGPKFRIIFTLSGSDLTIQNCIEAKRPDQTS